MSFSERRGLRPVKSVVQIEDIDTDLRNSLWNALTIFYWKRIRSRLLSDHGALSTLCSRLWLHYFKLPLDSMSPIWESTLRKVRDYFFKAEWHDVYDFIEFAATNYPDESETPPRTNEKFMDWCNDVLEREVAAYRFVGGIITQVSSEEEVSAIEEALASAGPYRAVQQHLHQGLVLMADRRDPDYRNSIKESISAVEAMCRVMTGNDRVTLGAALSRIETRMPLHPALKEAFSKLYGFTSDAEGIRHALLDESNLRFEDAKFMLVSCSAFINYLLAKSD